jgi:trk system potassium uptake protein TrkA
VKVVILGCGRVGAELARLLDQAGHHVTIIDSTSDSFQRLDPKFSGEKVIGNGIDEEVLKRAGIETADAFAAVTNGDNRNIMASQIAKEIFRVPKVVCRIYDPIRQSTYRDLGLEAFSPTIIGAEIMLHALEGKPLAWPSALLQPSQAPQRSVSEATDRKKS